MNSFTNIFGGGSSQTELTVGEGSMQLSGTIKNDFPIEELDIGLPEVQYVEPAEEPEFQDPVGLFSMKEKPEVTVIRKQFPYECRNNWNDFYSQYNSYGIYLQFDDSNMDDLFEVNPTSDMQLVEVKAFPVVEVQGPFLSFPYFPTYSVIYDDGLNVSDYSFGLNLYSGPGEINRFRTTFTFPHTPAYSDGHLIAGADSEEFPDQVTTVDGVQCLDALQPNAVDVDLRFYLKFEHSGSKEIKTEFMRTYKPDITHQDIFEF